MQSLFAGEAVGFSFLAISYTFVLGKWTQIDVSEITPPLKPLCSTCTAPSNPLPRQRTLLDIHLDSLAIQYSAYKTHTFEIGVLSHVRCPLVQMSL